MSRIGKTIILVCILGVGSFFAWKYLISTSGNRDVSGTQSDISPQISEHKTLYTVGEKDTFASILESQGIVYSDMLEILNSASSTYDFTSVRVGRPFYFVRNDADELVRIEYEINSDEVVLVYVENAAYRAEKKRIAYEVTTKVQQVTVENSLYQDGLVAGIPETIIIDFANTFAWTIDFATQVQSGDTMQVAYEERYRDGKQAGYGRILVGSFVNEGTEYRGYLFHDEDGKDAYYNEKGEALIKQFLRAPLSYSRITSGFTYGRFHPVLQQNYNHLAIDYGAAAGTPIMAVGDGTVVFAGWSNIGFGNFISIRHNERYTTEYAHLSSFAKGIKVGMRVQQGQTIGYVGSTGFATGAHLHYQIKEYGTLVNPLKIELPPGDPVPDSEREAFGKVVEGYTMLLK